MSRKRRFPFIKNPTSRRADSKRTPTAPADNLGAADAAVDAEAFDAASLVGAYSIGATDPEQAAWLHGQLAADPEVAQELAAYQELANLLLHSAQPIQPPPELRNRLAATIEAESNAGRVGRPQAVPNRLPQAKAVPRSGIWGLFPSFKWSKFQMATAALLALLIVTNLVSLTKIRALQSAQTRLWNQILSEQYTQQSLVQVILAANETTSFEVAAAQDGGRAHAYVEWCPQTYTVLIEAGDFPVLAPDMTYQLWLVRDGQRRSGGLFTVDSWGSGKLVMQLEEPLDGFDVMGITTEPAGGSDGPTSPPVVRKEF